MKSLIVLAVIFISGCAINNSREVLSPKTTVRSAFKYLCADDSNKAMTLFYISVKMQKQVVENKLSGHAKRMSADKLKFEVIESKVEGNFAVVIVNEKKAGSTQIDLDPIFLRRTSEGWKISPGFTNYMYLIGQDGEGGKEYTKLN